MLSLSKEKLEYLLKCSPDGTHIIDSEGNLAFYSETFMINLGYENYDELLNFNVCDWDPIAASAEPTPIIKSLIDTPETFITKHKKKDNSIITVEINAKGVLIDGEKYLYASQRIVDTKNINQADLATKFLASEKTKYKTILELASDGVFIMDYNGKLVEYSEKAKQMLGYSADEMQNLNVYDWDKDIDKAEYSQLIEALKQGPIEVERTHTRKNNTKYIAYITANLINIDNQSLLYASARDITEQKENERTIIEQNEQLEAIFQTALGGISLLSLDGVYEFVNNKYCEFLEYSDKELLGKSTFEFTDEKFITEYQSTLKKVAVKLVYENFEHTCLTKSGKIKRLMSSIALMPNNRQLLMTTVDNTDLSEAMTTIKKQAFIDDLTKLNNKRSYNNQINKNLEIFENTKEPFSMIIFDIDFFKRVNDNYGHLIGDRVLEEFSKLITSNIRNIDSAFRIGGEEFALILKNTSLKNADRVAEKLRVLVEQELKVIKNETITISAGVTEVKSGDTADKIYKRADDCLYKAKSRGRNCSVSI